MRLFVLARHGESVLNTERRVNGDPRVGVPLTPLGESQARSLGEQVANLPLDVCVHTTFGRSHATAHLAIAGLVLDSVRETVAILLGRDRIFAEAVDSHIGGLSLIHI